MVEETEKLYNKFAAEGRNVTFVNARFVKPIDEELIGNLAKTHKLLVIIEEGIKHGGYGSLVEEYLAEKGCDANVMTFAIEDEFVKHGTIAELRRELLLDYESMYERINERL